MLATDEAKLASSVATRQRCHQVWADARTSISLTATRRG